MTPAVAGAAAPAVSGITPVSGANTTTIEISNLAGTNFTTGATVMLTPVAVKPVHKSAISNSALSGARGVYVSGNYAYVASDDANALAIIDITNPAAPVLRNSITNGGSTLLSGPQSVYVSGNYAYVASHDSNGLEIVDVTNPAAPVHRGSIANGAGGALLLGPQSVYVSGNYAFVASSDSNALEIVDVTNPAAPVHRGSIANGAGGSLLSNPYSVHVSGNYAYVASSGSNALEIVDVTNPAAPIHVGSIANGVGGALLSIPQSVYVSGNYAYVISVGSDALEIVDVTNPAAPVHKGSIANGAGGALLLNPYSIHVSGNYAYVASSQSSALEIIDVTNPVTPVHKGSISNGGTTLLLSPQSVYVSGNYAYVASFYNNALEIIELGTVTATNVQVVSPNQITCTFNLNNKATGPYNVVVTNPDGKFGTLSSGFTINTGDVPVVSFRGTPTSGRVPLTVTFTDTSTMVPTSWNWSFGDGTFSPSKNPVHTYSQGGVYTVTLNATNSKGTGTLTRPNYIGVTFTINDGIAIFRPSTGYWYFDNNLDSSINSSIRYGSSTDQIIAGNWQGTGDGIAIFRPSTGYWYFDYTLSGIVDKSIRYGSSTDQIIKGNWQGTGRDGIAIFRPSTGYWYFDYNLDGAVDRSFRYGSSGDQIIKGNWTGTRDGIAIFRPSTGYWYFDYNLDGSIDKSFRYGSSTDRIIAGNWQGTGRDGIAIFRPSTGYWYFDYNLDGVVDKSIRYGSSTDRIIAGDWQGTGRDGIAIFRPSTGYWYFDNYLDGVVDKSFRYGSSTDRIIAGKWISVSPVAAFTSDVQTGSAPLTVRFTGQSTGTAPLSYAWDFNNDGVIDNNAKSPTYVYAVDGDYTVSLTVTNSLGSDSEVKVDYITVNPAPVAPVAAFRNTTSRIGTAPLTVTFTDESTGSISSYAWDFNNDGTNESTLQNPEPYTYATPGTYTVNLTVTGLGGNDSEVKTDYITVNPAPAAPVAGFSGSPRSGSAPLTVTFSDASTGTITSRSWEYRNATVGWTEFATTVNPSNAFPVGEYDIRLTVTGPGGSNTKTETGYITVSAAPVAGFSGSPRSGSAPLTVTFSDASTGTITSRSWEYKNATVLWTEFATTVNPSNAFPVGEYDIRLTVTGPGGSNTKTENGYIEVTLEE
jgi:PKD repeat protein